MTPVQITAIQAHAAKIQAAYRTLQFALEAATRDNALPAPARGLAGNTSSLFRATVEDATWFNNLTTPDAVIASFE